MSDRAARFERIPASLDEAALGSLKAARQENGAMKRTAIAATLAARRNGSGSTDRARRGRNSLAFMSPIFTSKTTSRARSSRARRARCRRLRSTSADRCSSTGLRTSTSRATIPTRKFPPRSRCRSGRVTPRRGRPPMSGPPRNPMVHLHLAIGPPRRRAAADRAETTTGPGAPQRLARDPGPPTGRRPAEARARHARRRTPRASLCAAMPTSATALLASLTDTGRPS